MNLDGGEVLLLPVKAEMLLWVLMMLVGRYRCRYLEGLATGSVLACWGQRPGCRESMASGR